ncbi:MAG TPA: histone deacetylase, partial [Acidimicrobiales bacterium]|nr:histone deacetylase [Acidimicrobiales bacterium]
EVAFVAARPPGHHATADEAMGFCLLNNVAVAAAALTARGERVAIVDYDVHHGNGTQDVFYEDPHVLYVSLHQWPLYPGTGRLEDTGAGAGEGTTLNLPMRPGTSGDPYRAALDQVIIPAVEAFSPTWMVLSAGFDGHRADPLADLVLTAGDFADLTARLVSLVPAGRRLAFLEGGYDLDSLATSAGACVAALAGVAWRPEPASSGGPDAPVVAEAARRLAERSDRAGA